MSEFELLRHLRILHAEDDPLIRIELEAMLGEHVGFLCCCEDGLEAWNRYGNDDPYDIIITDIKMPGMDGLELAKRIKQSDPNQRIIVASAASDADKIIDLINIGVDRFIPKPIHYDNLLRILEGVATLIASQKRLVEYQQALEDQNRTLERALGELKETQEKLVESKKMASLGMLVSGIAHEINTPLGIAITSISHQKELLESMGERFDAGTLKRQEMAGFLSDSKEANDLALGNLERTARLVQLFKQISLEQYVAKAQSVDFLKLGESLRLAFMGQLSKQGVSLEFRARDITSLITYPDVLEEILVQLIQNALSHAFEPSHKEPQILLELFKESGGITLFYRDNGKGIDPEARSRIFDPFYTNARFKGHVGLGLSILFNLATQKLNGEVICEDPETRGFQLRIRLPMAPKIESL